MAKTDTARKLYGLLGRNISYSLSPAIHNAAFRHFGISAEYSIFDTPPEMLEQFIRENVLSGRVEGINVTVPYKTDALRLLEENIPRADINESPFVRLAGAINTVGRTGSALELHNTDGEGFYSSLLADAGVDPSKKKVFILGAGGAGRVIALYLASLGGDAPAEIRVFDINRQSLDALKTNVNGYRGSGILTAHVEIQSDHRGIEDADIVVNATPLGTKEGDGLPLDGKNIEALKKKCVIYDLVYARSTELVRAARERGLRAASGEGMLANQGALAFALWTGKSVEEVKPVMRAALTEALGSTR